MIFEDSNFAMYNICIIRIETIVKAGVLTFFTPLHKLEFYLFYLYKGKSAALFLNNGLVNHTHCRGQGQLSNAC